MKPKKTCRICKKKLKECICDLVYAQNKEKIRR